MSDKDKKCAVSLMTKEEKEKWEEHKDKDEAEFTEYYDNCYCNEW